MTSPGRNSEKNVQLDYYALESIKQQQTREHLLAERRARIHEASLAYPQGSGRLARMISFLWGRESAQSESDESSDSELRPVMISTNALNGD